MWEKPHVSEEAARNVTEYLPLSIASHIDGEESRTPPLGR